MNAIRAIMNNCTLITVISFTIIIACNNGKENKQEEIKLLFENKKYDSLTKLLEANLAENKHDTFSLYYLAYTYFRVKNYENALNTLKKVSPNDEWKNRFLLLKYHTLVEMDNYLEALKQIDTLIINEPSNDDYFLESAVTNYNLFAVTQDQ